MLHADYPSKKKRGDVYIFYNTTIPLRVLNISFVKECITFEISIGNKVCCFIHHRSPSQTQDKFQRFISDLKLNLHALFIAVKGGSYLPFPRLTSPFLKFPPF